jgi:hypothetical protein
MDHLMMEFHTGAVAVRVVCQSAKNCVWGFMLSGMWSCVVGWAVSSLSKTLLDS